MFLEVTTESSSLLAWWRSTMKSAFTEAAKLAKEASLKHQLASNDASGGLEFTRWKTIDKGLPSLEKSSHRINVHRNWKWCQQRDGRRVIRQYGERNRFPYRSPSLWCSFASLKGKGFLAACLSGELWKDKQREWSTLNPTSFPPMHSGSMINSLKTTIKTALKMGTNTWKYNI